MTAEKDTCGFLFRAFSFPRCRPLTGFPNNNGVLEFVGWVGCSRTTHPRREKTPCTEFIARHQEQISGVFSGFNRLAFRGTLRRLAYATGMAQYLSANQVLLQFGAHVRRVSRQLKQAPLAEATCWGRPVEHLASSRPSKEQIARRIAAHDHIDRGLVCLLSRGGALPQLPAVR